MKLLIIVGLILLCLVTVRPVEAFGLADLANIFKGPASSQNQPTATIDQGGIKGLICKYTKLLCPNGSSGTNTPNSSSAPSTKPTTGTTKGIPSLIGQPPTVSTFLGIGVDVVKRLWGDNPPPTWGGISGGGEVPVPGTSGGANPGVISGCTGSLGSCASACQSNQAGCNARYCYCAGGGSGPDCKTLITLSSHFPGASKCSNGVTNGSKPAASAGAVVGTPVQGCLSGDVQGCIAACKADLPSCQKRIADCRAGRATGGDCDSFANGYQICCTTATDLASCRAQDEGLTNTFCGVSGSSSKGSLQLFCESSAENEVDCKTAETACDDPNGNPLVDSICQDIASQCSQSTNTTYCQKRGYI